MILGSKKKQNGLNVPIGNGSKRILVLINQNLKKNQEQFCT